MAAAGATAPTIELTQTTQRFSLAGHARVWIDTTGKATLEQARDTFDLQLPASMNVRQEDASYALTGQAMWLMFTARNLHANGRWHLEVGLPTTDLAVLYYQAADGKWIEQAAGDSLLPSQWAIKDRYPLFAMSDEAGRPIAYFLRIKHDRAPYSARIVLATDEAVLASRQLENLVLGLYFGMLLTVMIFCGVYGLALRYPNYFRYALYVGVLGYAQVGFLGLGTQYITPSLLHWNSVASFVLPYVAVAVALWLVRAFTRPSQFAPWLDRALIALCSFMCVLAMVETIMPSMLGFRVANVAMILCMAAVYVLLWQSASAGDRNARWIALGFSPVVISAMFPVLRNFGVLNTGFLTQYAVMIGSAIEVPLLMYALMRRSASQRDMRIREQALKQQDALTGLSDERRLLSKLHSSILRSRRYGHRLGLLHVRLQNHDHLAKEFGGQVANAAMLLTASHLRSVSREIDLPCRLPGNEFMLLVEGPTNGARLIEASTQLLAHSLRPSNALPVGTQPRLLICAALLPTDEADELGGDANATYQWLLSHAELASEDNPRKVIRSINF